MSEEIKYSMGWKPSLPDIRDFRLQAKQCGPLPDAVDLRKEFPGVWEQLSLNSCHDSHTEVLTSGGWKLFSDCNDEDLLASVDQMTKKIIFEKPKKLIKFKYTGEMFYNKNKSLDFLLTPDHEMVVRKWDNKSRTLKKESEKIKIKDIGWYSGLINSVNYSGNLSDNENIINIDGKFFYSVKGIENHKYKKYRTDLKIRLEDWMQFIGIYLAEGTMLTYSKRRNYNKIQLAASKERERAFISNLLKRMEIKSPNIKDRFTFQNSRIYKELEKLGLNRIKAPFKFIPKFIFLLPPEQIDNFLLGYFMGDGSKCKDNGNCYHTSSEKMADELQLLIFLSGRWATIHKQNSRTSKLKDGRFIKSKHDIFTVLEWKGKSLAINRKKHITKVNYDGFVYCAEMPTYHTLVTRRNKKILISGNCTANAAASLVRHTLKKDGAQNADEHLSRLFLYYATREQDNSVKFDQGATFRDTFKALARIGICAEECWPYMVDKVKVKPGARAYKDANKRMAKNYFAVPQSEESLKQCLAEGYGFVFGFAVYESFVKSDVKTSGNVPIPNTKERVLGGHAVTCVGYTPTHFIIRNSWGSSWGDKGHCYMPMEFILHPSISMDFWTLRQI